MNLEPRQGLYWPSCLVLCFWRAISKPLGRCCKTQYITQGATVLLSTLHLTFLTLLPSS
jgi:hypothetical protein